jgi:hypothetical protein
MRSAPTWWPIALERELRLDARDQFLVAEAGERTGPAGRVHQAGDLLVTEAVHGGRLGRVVAVDVDDHERLVKG